MLGRRPRSMPMATAPASTSPGPTSRKGQGSVGRRTQSRPSGPDAEGGRQPSSSSTEPTNDLDVNTLRALEEGWKASPVAPSSAATTAGSSDRIATHITGFQKAIAK